MRRYFQILLMMLALCSESVSAQPRPRQAGLDAKFKLDAERQAKQKSPLFSKTQFIEGVEFQRLRGNELIEAIRGVHIVETIPSNSVPHQSFGVDGRYLLSGDFAWVGVGGYLFANDLVATWLGADELRNHGLNIFAVYRSRDRRFFLAWLERDQPAFAEIRVTKMTN